MDNRSALFFCVSFIAQRIIRQKGSKARGIWISFEWFRVQVTRIYRRRYLLALTRTPEAVWIANARPPVFIISFCHVGPNSLHLHALRSLPYFNSWAKKGHGIFKMHRVNFNLVRSRSSRLLKSWTSARQTAGTTGTTYYAYRKRVS